MLRTLPNRLRLPLLVFAALIVVGTVGFMLLEGYTVLDGLYMTITAVSTVGFGEIQPLSPTGRVFTILLILVGVGTAAFFFTSITEYIVAGELRDIIRGTRTMRHIERLSDHFVVCGFGRVGEQVASELSRLGLDFVVVDREPTAARRCEERGYLFLQGDAESDEVLRRAGIDRARGVVSVLASDADNVFAVLSARALKPELLIVARATTEAAERKLLKAGADRVVSPYVMAGNQIVGLLVRPNVVNFLDRARLTEELGLWLEEVEVGVGSPLAGETLADLDLRGRLGATVLAIVTQREKRAIVQWSPDLRLQPGDVLIVLGARDSLTALARLAADTRFTRPSSVVAV